MLRYFTAGESHGQALMATLLGLPAQVPVDFVYVNRELKRRMGGYGRGGRQKIEKDQADFLAGVGHGQTIGATTALRIENRDWKNWERALPVGEIEGAEEAQRPLIGRVNEITTAETGRWVARRHSLATGGQ